MNNNKELKERIGIDRSVLCDFTILDIIQSKLEAATATNSKNQYSKLSYDNRSPIRLSNGKGIGKLIVKDKQIGKLTISFEKNNLNGQKFIRSNLEMTISSNGNNLQNLNAEEYRTRIRDIFELLENTYGIIVDYSTIKIKQIELNATFYLKEPYEKYQKAILMIMRNVPPDRYSYNDDNNSVKYATWHEANLAANKNKLETALVKNNSIELKIYNKGKHLQDIGERDSLERDIMRIEYKIKDKRTLKRAFWDDLVTSLTDDKITRLYKQYFDRDVVLRYEQWTESNQKQLLEVVQQHKQQKQKWVGDFFRYCREYEAVNGLPLLFDVKDMLPILKILEPTNKNIYKKFKRLKQKAVYESDLIGNTIRMKEIINKIATM